MANKLLSGILGLALALATHAASGSSLQPFADTSLADWQQRSFFNHSQYQITNDDGIRVLKGSAEAQASLLYKPFTVSLQATPLLSWHWKIDNILTGSNEQTRRGDDFPARVYVAYQYGRFAWQTYAITYVWASHTPKNSSWASPFTQKVKLIALQSGDALVGQWQYESRNVADDFKTLFGVDVQSLDGLGIMVDTDNTGKSAVAYFGAIEFSSGH